MNEMDIHKRTNKAAGLFGTVALVLGAGAPAVADDTELFVARSDPSITGAQPNILFIIDTSGSMDTEVVTQLEYDPEEDWDGCYEEDAIYFSDTDQRPDCDSNDYFWKSANSCAAAVAQFAQEKDTAGVYKDNLRAWRGGFWARWIDLRGNRKSRPVECEADRGKHGDGGSERWAANRPQGPWHTDDSNEPRWNLSYTIWDGNWLNWNTTGGTVVKERIEIVQEVTIDLLNDIEDVNVGLMRFNYDDGGPVIHAMEDIDSAREDMIDTIEDLPASGWTPLSETMYEAGQYYAGRNVDFGNVGDNKSVAESRLGGSSSSNTYLAPVNAACQKNYIVLLTDGAPTRDTGAQSKIESLPGFSSLVGSTCDGGTGDGVCLDDMASYLYEADLDEQLPGQQNVTTYTIGFTVDLPLLAETASDGGGEYYLADNTATLASVLTEIVLAILDDATTFTAPSVPVNAFNRTQNLNDVFVSVFQPTGSVHWPGNLKKYTLSAGELVGQDAKAAVDPNTGFFKKDARSFWSPAADGDRAGEGGAASQIPEPATRNVYTDIAGAPLTATGNAFKTSNSGITAEMLGTSSITRDLVINWFRGVDVFDEDDDDSTTDARLVMGDPLHVRPVTVIYGGTQQNPDAVVFTATNDGQVHAVDADNGVELWTYIPSRLLGRLNALFLDDPTPNKAYGLDGTMRVHIVNDDGLPGISGGERVLLVFGMRRGGDSVFALDVTDRNAPIRLWEINGNTPGFENLGQTWSTPVVTEIVAGGGRKTVAIFGGGYDDGQDNFGFRTDTAGNALYIVDALTGAKIWSAGNNPSHDLVLPEMQHSIPAPMAVIDVNQDRLADRMYVGDMGGRVWRFDIVNGASGPSLVEGGVIASLGAADLPAPAPASEVRRFYAAPDVVPVVSEDKFFYTVNLGSGYRAHPLDTTIEDEFFSIRDFNVQGVIDTDDYPPPLTRTDLVDVTNDANPTLLVTDNGWRLRMVQSTGEKILNRSTTFQNAVFFSSFTPGAASNACVATQGLNRLYQVNVLDGSALTNLDGSIDEEGDPLTETDRFKQLKQGGIAPEGVILFPADQPEMPVLCVGVECFDPDIGNVLVRTFWTQDGT